MVVSSLFCSRPVLFSSHLFILKLACPSVGPSVHPSVELVGKIIYMRSCTFIRGSVCQSVGRSVRPQVTLLREKEIDITNNHTITPSVQTKHRLVKDASSASWAFSFSFPIHFVRHTSAHRRSRLSRRRL